MDLEPSVTPHLQAVRTDVLYQIKVDCYFSVSPKVDSCVFLAVASGFYVPTAYFRTVLELGSVCCISAGHITSGIKTSVIKDDASSLITLLYITLDPTDEISGSSACHLEYIISLKVY